MTNIIAMLELAEKIARLNPDAGEVDKEVHALATRAIGKRPKWNVKTIPPCNTDEVFEQIALAHGFKKPHRKADALYWFNEAVDAMAAIGVLKLDNNEGNL